MAYTRDKPAASDILSTSQNDIKNNFNTADTSFAINHYAFIETDSDLAGKHKYCTLQEQSEPTLVDNEVSLYNKETDEDGTKYSALYMKNEGASGTEVQLSLQAKHVSAAASGSSYLPGGVIIKWGFVTGASGERTVTFGEAFPNNCWSVAVAGNANDTAANSINVYTLTTASFKAKDAGGWGFYYIAIGN